MEQWNIEKYEVFVPSEKTFGKNVSVIEHPHGGLVAIVSFKEENQKSTSIFFNTYYFDESRTTWFLQGEKVRLNLIDKEISAFSQTTFLNLMGNLQTIYSITKQSPENLTELYFSLSHDYGKTWKHHNQLMEKNVPWEMRNNPIHVGMGRLLLPIYDKGNGRSFAYISDDTGKTWFPSVYIEPSEELMDDTSPDGFFAWKMQSPVFIQAGERKILCFLQPKNHHQLMMSHSNDFGETWANAGEIDIPSGFGGIDAVRLRDGNGNFLPIILLVYSQKNDEGKTIIKLAVSHDIGETWEGFKELDILFSPYTDISVIQTDDNMLHIVYSTKQGVNHLMISNIGKL